MKYALSVIMLLLQLACLRTTQLKNELSRILMITYAESGSAGELNRETVTVFSNGFARLQVDNEEYVEYMSEQERSKLIAIISDPTFGNLLKKDNKEHYEGQHLHVTLYDKGTQIKVILFVQEMSPDLKQKFWAIEDSFEGTFGYHYQRIRKYTGV